MNSLCSMLRGHDGLDKQEQAIRVSMGRRSHGGYKCLLVFLVVLLQSCNFLASSKQPPVAAAPASIAEFSPAGVWLYEDRIATGEATLDENGNGSYPWKDGYFVTSGWDDGLWTGTWHQPGNDREGGFELQLSADLTFAAGRWWYTRIGDNHSPDKPGGKFTLTRISY